MIRNYNHENAWSVGLPLVSVRFEFMHPTATIVSVAGTFNDWHPTTKSMYPSGEGCWLKEAFLPPGNYEYCLVVDGRWMPDPLAKGHVPNPFGGWNSILKVAIGMEAIPPAGSRAGVGHGSATTIDIFRRSPARGEPPVAGLDWIDASLVDSLFPADNSDKSRAENRV
jgi:hypothetical protein